MGKPKPPWGASEEALRLAVAGATGFTRDPVYLPALGATEGERDLHLIWRHCMYYQILPEAMRGLSRDVL